MIVKFLSLCVLFFIIVIIPLPAAPVPEHFRFDSFTPEDGLANSSVSGIVQDGEGLIWIATQAGLNKFDGYTFTHYEHDPFNTNSLSHNLVQTMYLDSDDSLWLGTYGGLNHFDPVSESFTRYIHNPENESSLSNNIVTAIMRDAQGRLWVGTLDGLNRFKRGFRRFRTIFVLFGFGPVLCTYGNSRCNAGSQGAAVDRNPGRAVSVSS